jgi:hypothetical protein
MKTEPNEPINPIVVENFNYEQDRGFLDDKFQGLTKREHFALELTKAVVTGVIKGSGKDDSGWMPQHFAKEGLMLADVLIEELNKTQQ